MLLVSLRYNTTVAISFNSKFNIQHSKFLFKSYQHDLDKKISQSVYFILRLNAVFADQLENSLLIYENRNFFWWK